MTASKTTKRLTIIDSITECLLSPKIYETIDFRRQGEAQIKQFMYQPLIKTVTDLHVTLNGISPEYSIKKAEETLLWEGNKKTTVSNLTFFGVQHRPDMALTFDNCKYAVEIKRGKTGAGLREGRWSS